MIKKKLLFGLLCSSGAFIVASGIVAGYICNSSSHKYAAYYTAPQSGSTNDLIQAYFSAIVNNSKLLYLASYAHTTSITNALNITKQKNAVLYEYFSKAGYLLIDDVYGFPLFDDKTGEVIMVDPPVWNTNVASIQFRADLGSFVTGIAIAQFLNENQDYFGDNLTWATYGGQSFPTVVSFMGGLQQGIEFYNTKIAPKVNGYKTVEQIFLGNKYQQNFSDSFDPNGGTDIINQFFSLERKPSVFIPVAGGQTQQAVRKIRQDSLRTVVIGVDSPVEEDDTVNIPLPSSGANVGNGKIVQFSTVKNVNVATDKITRIINGDSIPENDLGGIGYASLGTLDNGCVGVSTAGYPFFIKAIKLLEAISNNTQVSQNIVSDIINTVNGYSSEELTLNYNNCLTNTNFYSYLSELDKSENKKYVVGHQGEKLEYSYESIPNTGMPALPITSSPQELRTWYTNVYSSDPDKIRNIDKNISTIQKWILDNKEAIEERSVLSKNLQNQFSREAYESDNRIIKIIFQDSSSVLFDHSFLQSCYLGLCEYWKTQGIQLPPPPSSNSSK